MRMIEKLKVWINMYGFCNVIKKVLYQKLPFNMVYNHSLLRRMNWQFRVRKKIAKYVTITDMPVENNVSDSKIMWWLWFQGSENAPEIVRKCYSSAKSVAQKMEFEFIELNNDNIFNYVNLPEKIKIMWKNKKISNANFSDLCRISLLADYGGLWIDSTVYLSDVIDEEILDSDIFFFQASFLDLSVTKMSNWFMYSKRRKNCFFCSMRDTLVNYWSNNSVIPDYFIFHLFASLIMEKNQFKKLITNMPYMSNTYPSLLERELREKYDEVKIKYILKKSRIHKLTYKNLECCECDSLYYRFIERDKKI